MIGSTQSLRLVKVELSKDSSDLVCCVALRSPIDTGAKCLNLRWKRLSTRVFKVWFTQLFRSAPFSSSKTCPKLHNTHTCGCISLALHYQLLCWTHHSDRKLQTALIEQFNISARHSGPNYAESVRPKTYGQRSDAQNQRIPLHS